MRGMFAKNVGSLFQLIAWLCRSRSDVVPCRTLLWLQCTKPRPPHDRTHKLETPPVAGCRFLGQRTEVQSDRTLYSACLGTSLSHLQSLPNVTVTRLRCWPRKQDSTAVIAGHTALSSFVGPSRRWPTLSCACSLVCQKRRQYPTLQNMRQPTTCSTTNLLAL